MNQPLRISVDLVSGVAGGIDLPIDGILAAAWMRKNRPDLYYGIPPIKISDMVDAELPLLKLGEGSNWYWSASFAFWPEASADDMQYWNKRMDQREIHRVEFGNRGKLDIAAGRYKAYHMPLPVRSALNLVWYVNGDPELIEALLHPISFLGKKRSQGFGQVRSWKVIPTSEDWSCKRDGLPTRTVPIEQDTFEQADRDGFAVGPRTIRPPYWFSQLAIPCLLPNREALVAATLPVL